MSRRRTQVLWFMLQSYAYEQQLRIHMSGLIPSMSNAHLQTAKTQASRQDFTSGFVSNTYIFCHAYCTQTYLPAHHSPVKMLGTAMHTHTHTCTQIHADFMHQGGKGGKVSHSDLRFKTFCTACLCAWSLTRQVAKICAWLTQGCIFQVQPLSRICLRLENVISRPEQHSFWNLQAGPHILSRAFTRNIDARVNHLVCMVEWQMCICIPTDHDHPWTSACIQSHLLICS